MRPHESLHASAPPLVRAVLLVACLSSCAGGDAGDARDGGVVDGAGTDGSAEADSGARRDAATPADATTQDDGAIGMDGGRPGDAGAPADSGLDAGDDCAPGECCYELVYESPGVFHTVTEADPQHVVRPLEAGEGFFCMRVEYTMQTADNIEETDAEYEGCPIFSHIGGIQGGAADGRVVGGAFFRMLRLGCDTRRPVAVQLDVWAPPEEERSTTLTGPWLPGETYRVVQEVVPFTSSIELSQDGATVGPRVESDISGTTVDMTRDTEVHFGLEGVITGAYFPYFEAVYSDLEIWADVAPAP